jgi:type VI secretion system protein ImpK
VIEGAEKLSWLTAQLGEDIARIKGDRAGFAPHGMLPEQVEHKLKRDVPVWAVGATFALAGLLAWFALSAYLRSSAQSAIAPYSQIIQLAPPQANLTIVLP